MAIATLAATSPAALAAHSCPGFSVNANGLRYHFYDVRAKRAACRTVRRVIRGFLHGRGRATGDSANDPVRVYGWNVFIIDLTASGRRHGRSFEARYET